MDTEYVVVIIIKQVKDLYDKTCKTFKMISEDGKITHAHGPVGLI